MIDPGLLLNGSVALLVAGPVIAHLAGTWLARRLSPGPQGARSLMPAPLAAPPGPEADEADRRTARRFLAEVEAAEAVVLARVAEGLGGLEAGRVAEESGASALALESALDRLSARLPHRLRITRDGKRLYDFEREPAAALAGGRGSGVLARALFLGAAGLANLGAAFPLLVSVGVAGAVVMGCDSLEQFPIGAGLGAVAIGGIVGAAVLSGEVLARLLTPLGGGPVIGRVASVVAAGREAAKSRRIARKDAERARSGTDGGGWLDGLELKDAKGLGQLLEDPKGCLVVLAIALFVAAVVGSLVGIVAWIMGLWRAVARLLDAGTAPPSPADWTRAPEEPTSFEAVIPTNDVALAASGAISRALRGAAPADAALEGRVLARAAGRGGRISPLEIVLEEGLEPGAATGLASRLAAFAGGGGEIVWTLEKDPDFLAPKAGAVAAKGAMGGPPPPPETDRGEYLDPASLAPVAPAGGPLPSNLPGLAGGHLRAAARLAGGTSLLAGGAIWALSSGAGEAVPGPVAALLVLVALLHLGTLVLAGATGYAARAAARTGLLRDARRAVLAAVRSAVRSGERRLDATALTRRIHAAIEEVGGGVPKESVRTEVVGALVDLGLDPAGAASAVEQGGATIFPLDPLSDRLSALENARREKAAEETPSSLAMPLVAPAPTGNEGEVVFDSEKFRRRAAGG